MGGFRVHRKNSSSLIDRLIQWTGIVLLITITSLPTAQTAPICYGNVDVIFVIDASYSILDQSFQLVCKFVEELYTKILVDTQYDLRAGVIFYASEIYTGEFKISLNGDQNQIIPLLGTFKRDLLNIKTNTGAALKEAYDMFKSQGRSDAVQIMTLITNGVADDPALVFTYASKFREDNIHAVAVGIGVAGESIDEAQLNMIATSQDSVFIFTEMTPDLSMAIQKDICGKTLDSKGPPVVEKDDVRMDIYFLLDEAMLAQDLGITKTFMKSVLQTFVIGTDKALASVFLYGRTTGNYFLVGSYTTEQTLFAAIDGLSLTLGNGDVRNVAGILTELSSRISGSPTSGPVIVVLFVTGEVSNFPTVIPLTDAFREASNPSIYLIVIGVGTDMESLTSEQNRMAYDVGTVFQAGDFLALSGNNVASTEFISSVRKTIYQLASGTYVTQGAAYRWARMFDVVFVMDGSSLMTQMARSPIVRYVLKELIDEFELGPDKARVAVLVCDAAGVYNSIRFDTYNHDHDTLKDRIDKLLLIQRQDTVDNAVCLAAMRKYFLENNRESAAKLGYLITLGQANNRLLAEAEARALAFLGVQQISIGIDSGVSEFELNSYQMFEPVDGPVLISPIWNLASTENLLELKADLLKYASIFRPRGRYFQWDAAFDFIILVHDESGRIDGGASVKYFLQDVFHRYVIGTNNVLAGVITFGANVNKGTGNEIILGSDSFYTSLYLKINQLNLIPTGGPNVLAALDELMAMFASYGRPNTAKVALLVIQGDVRLDDLEAKIQQVRDAGISMAAIGIGPQTDIVDLKNIAFNSEAELAFLQTSWQRLGFTPAMDASVIALARGIYQPQGIGNILKLPTRCNGIEGYQPGIVFILDASDSISDDFDNLKAFTTAMMSGFAMPGVDIGALAFANQVLPGYIPIGEYQTYIELYAHFMNNINIQPEYKTTYTYLAIEKMVEMFDTAPVDYKEKIAILLTDGKSVNPDETEQEAIKARNAGIKLIAIGIGGILFDDELEAITGGEKTGDVSHKFIFTRDDLTNPSKLEAVQSLICSLIRPGFCDAGNYRDPVTLECDPCPVGTYQGISEQLFCEKCEEGKTTSSDGTVDSSSCYTDCDAGYYLNVATTTCVICPLGEYQPQSGQTQCLKCDPPTTITKFTGSTSKDDCTLDKCSVPSDLVFVVDATASIGIINFNLLKAFLGNQLERFEIGSNLAETRISIVRIGTETTDDDVTDFLTDKSIILQNIRELQGFDLSTNTASAIEKASSKLDSDGRTNIAKVIFIVTDGISKNPFETRYQALLAQQKYEIAVLGVGSQYFMPELQGLASDLDFILTESDFFNLPSLDAYTTICKAAAKWVPPDTPVDPAVKCNLVLDLILVINSPENLLDTEFTLLKYRLVNFIDRLEISSTKVEIGILSFAENIGQKFELSGDKVAIDNSLRDLPRSGLGTATNKALTEAKNMLDASSRPSAAKAVIVIVLKESNNYIGTVSLAELLEESGIYAVSVGKGTTGGVLEAELDAISTTGSDNTIFVPTLMETTLPDSLESKLCPESFQCSYRLHVAYIWYLSGSGTVLEKATKLSTDISSRFANVVASVIEVSDSTEIKTLLLALTEAERQMGVDQLYDTIHNIVIVTDKPLSDLGTDSSAILTKTTALKLAGVKILIVNARGDNDVGWVPYSTSSQTVFFEENFDELVPSWKIQTTLCREPCTSGYQIGEDGRCEPCGVGTYRDKDKSYICVACSEDSTTTSTGSTSVNSCTIKTKCTKPMDLGFVIDATLSIGINYNVLKAFFWTLVEKFPVGLRDNETRIAVVKIGEEVTDEDFTLFSQSTNDIAVKSSIIRLQGNEDQTNTAASLTKVLEIFKAEGRDQQTYPHLVLVATDGKSENTFQTKRYASILKLNGIRTLVIALGSGVFQEEIEALAYDQDSIYPFDTYKSLMESNYIHERICDAAQNYVPVTPDTGAPDLLGECKSYMDIVFVIDASLSVTEFTFLKLKIFIVLFSKMLDIGQTKIRIGIISFSTQVHESEVFSLDECVDLRTLETFGVIPQTRDGAGTTNTAGALARMIDMFTQEGRQNSPYVGIIITDGKSNNPASTMLQAQLAKDKGIHIVAIGFGESIHEQELYDMATDPASVKVLSSFDDLTTEQLLEMSCSYNFTCPHQMDIIAVWDLNNFDTISRAEIFIKGLKKSFPNSNITNIFVDHVDDVAIAMDEGLQKLVDPSKINTRAARVLMIITDKELGTEVKGRLETKATEAKNAGVLVMMVDAAAVSNNAESIASNEKLSYVTDKFDVLPFNLVLQRSLCTEPCQSGEELAADGSCVKCAEDEYRNSRETFLCVDCPTGRSTEGSTGSDDLSDCLFGNCYAPMDIVFVIDSSDSILEVSYMWMKLFLHNTIRDMDISFDKTRVGLVPYTSDILVSGMLELQESTSQERVLQAVRDLTQGDLPTGTNTARAIDAAKDMLLQQGRMTGGVSHTIVVITDGISTNTYRTIEEAKKAKDNFIRVYSLGVGPNIFEYELDRIASDPDSKMIVNSFMMLASLQDFTKTICEDSFTCDKTMDVVIFEDRTSTDTAFTDKLDSFKTKLTSSNALSTVNSQPYTSMSQLDTLLKNQDLSNNPQNTKLIIIITKTDITESTVKESVSELKNKGGIVVLINANKDLENTNFITMVSSLEYLYKVENFNEVPAYRFIERKLCIEPCPDGEQRSLSGTCEKCAKGTYRVAADTHACVQCIGDKTTEIFGATKASDCIPNCGPGYKTVGDQCVECGLGEFQDESFQPDCDTCTSGYTTKQTLSTSEQDCIRNCDPGEKISSLDKDTCEECDENTYQPENAMTECLACPKNLFSSPGSDELDDCNDACGKALDIIFLVDASLSLSNSEFLLIKAFVESSVQRFKVSQTATRIGIIQFSDVAAVSPRLYLTESLDRNTVISLARSLIHSTRPGTNTADALDAAVQMFDAQGRANIHKNIVIITDGKSDNTAQTEAAATKAKKKFINIISIGVGNGIYLPELKKIATDDTAVQIFSSFYSLLFYNILPTICTPTQFTCKENMDIFYIKHGADATVDAQVTKFFTELTNRYPTGTGYTEINAGSGSLSDKLNSFSVGTNDPENTKILIIFTNTANSEGVTAAAVKEEGVVIAVVYATDLQTDGSFDTVVSNQDLLFYAQQFDESPYIDFILRSLCIGPCGDGAERDEAGLCTDCKKGEYRKSTESHVCLECDPQTTTSGTGATDKSECVACLATEWPCRNGQGCIDISQQCDGTPQCNDGSDEICNTCLKGSRWDGTQCIQCEKGTFQPADGQSECIKCPDGSTTPGIGTETEVECSVICDESGKELKYPDGGCVDCEIGYYRDKDNDAICVRCQDQFTTEQKASTSKDDCVPDCDRGQFWDTNLRKCVDCQIGTYQPQKYEKKCETCKPGTTTSSVKSVLETECKDPCTEGEELPADGTSSADCVKCPVGTYKSSADTTCQQCETGYTTVQEGSKAAEDCLPNCDKGSFFDEVLKTCQKCPAGEYQDETYKKECKKCEPGKTTKTPGSADSADCIVPCPAGYILPLTLDDGSCTPCPQGSYREDDPDIATCTECNSGNTTDQEGSTSPTDCKPDCKPGQKIVFAACADCEIGTYQTLPRQTSCIDCPDFTTTLETGADVLNKCIDACPSGKQMIQKNPMICEICLMNFYKEAGVDKRCTACPVNHITLSDGATSKDECVPNCESGQRWDAPTEQCIDCEVGTFQIEFYKDTCIKCREKWTTLGTGSKLSTDCIPDCGPGTRWDENALDCVECQKDEYQPNSYESECIKCSKGKFTDNTGAIAETECKDQCPLGEEMGPGGTSPADCVSCEVGTYKDASKPTCQPCPDGYITDTSGSTSSTECKSPCEKGEKFSSDLKICIKCESGSYQDEENQEDCKVCTPLGFTSPPGSTQLADCVPPCQPGSAWDSNLLKCLPCGIGQYQDEPNKETCKQCEDNKSTLTEGSSRAEDCIDTGCAVGEWRCDNGECVDATERCNGASVCQDSSDESNCCLLGQYYDSAAQQCTDCPPGTYKDDIAEISCLDCLKGDYSPAGSTSKTDCTECEAGKVFVPGNSECTDCPLNTYREPGMEECDDCPLDFTTEQTGSSSITDCKPGCTTGQYYNSETFKCEPCPVGQYQNQEKQTKCIKCQRGKTTPGTGSVNENQCTDICGSGETLVYDADDQPTTSCEPCPVGQYKDTASFVCKKCLSGFTTSGTGSTECLPNCPPGYYYPSKTSSTCLECEKGTYQPKPLEGSCIKCDGGKTTPIKGATTSLLCYDKCSDGFKYVPNTDSCEMCPQGTYREKDVDADCRECKDGFTTELTGTGAATEDDCVPDCPAGQYYNIDQDRCELCPSNTYQNKSYQYTCWKCPPGTSVSTSGSDESSDCQDPCTTPGEQLQPDGSCGKCEIGTAKIPPSTICKKCEAGFTTETTGSTVCVPDCDAGSYWDGTKCTPCVKGKYQPKKNQYECEDCLTGLTTRDFGSTSINQCEDICPDGFELQFDGICVPCEKNYYRTKGKQLQCTTCPDEFITFYEGSESVDDCNPPCDVGTAWSDATKKCEPCDIGFYQDEKHQTVCKECKNGKITLVTRAVSDKQCVGNCAPGTYYDEAASRCLECEKGTYQSEPNKDMCPPCTPGYTTDNKGSETPADCYDKCDSGYTYVAASDSCEPCGFDMYRDRDKHNVCQHCPAALMTKTDTAKSEDECVSRCSKGEYWDKDKRVCVKCPAGYYQPEASALECIPCEDGGITLTTGTILASDCRRPCLEGEEWDTVSKTCVPCPIGEYQDTRYEENCKPCDSDKTTQSTHSTSELDCKPPACQPGEWRCLDGSGCVPISTRCDGVAVCGDNSDEAGCNCQPGQFYSEATRSCQNCLTGTYQDQSGQFSCIDCPVGFTTTVTLKDSRDDCQEICNSGEKYDSVLKTCVQCPVGMYREKGKDSPETCIECPSPFTTESAGARDISFCVPKCDKGEYYNDIPTQGCQKCPLGYYQDEEYNQYSCTKCFPAGTTTIVEGEDSQSDCTDVCGLGEELPVDGTVKADCKKCKIGYYKDSTLYVCKKCETGYTTITEGSDSSDDCYKICSAGEEFDSSGTGCRPCDRGYYKTTPPDNTDKSCKPCPPGETTEVVGATSDSLCEDLCNDGLELSADKNSCEACQKGEYRKQGSGETECQSCGPGLTTATTGAATVDECRRDCGVGERYDRASDSCLKCPVGTYQDVPLEVVCKDCPTWKTTLEEGSDEYDDCFDPCKDGFQSVNDQCTQCPRGTYREQGVQATCQSCRDQFTTLAPASATVDQCVPVCNPGTHWDENADSCVSCESGTYNPVAYKLQCLPCPPDKPISAADFLSCQGSCPPGESWNAARQVCNWCPAGTYSLGENSPCEPCPTGFSSLMGAKSVNECFRVDCLPGYYKPPGASACLSCPSNQVSNPQRTGCLTCTGDSVPAADRGSCIKITGNCEPGSSWNVAAQHCNWCQPGTYGPGGTSTCQPCPTGKTSLMKAKSESDCFEVVCLAGYYKPPGTSDCLLCPSNQVSNPQRTGCLTCTGDSIPAADRGSCLKLTGNCEPGSSWNVAEQHCNWCQPGTYGPGGTSTCQPCPTGKTSLMKAKSESDCFEVDCIAGYYKPPGTLACLSCPSNQVSDPQRTGCLTCTGDSVPAADRGSCLRLSGNCEPGASWNVAEQHCNWCQPGTYGPGGTSACQPCPTGKTSLMKAKSESDCFEVPCSGGEELSGNDCVPCSAGTYKPAGNTGSCLPCPRDQYQSRTGQTSCENCPDGKITLTTGSSSVDMCKLDWCTSGGQQLIPGTVDCEDCDLGTYKPVGMMGECILCNKTSYQDQKGQTDCKLCTPDGYHTMAPGAKSLSDCSADWCPAGQTHKGTCTDCGFGKFRSLTDVGCQNCPSGITYSLTAGSLAECKGPCPAGSFINLNTKSCELCEKGTYSTAENQFACTQCPDGLRTAAKGSTSIDMCKENWCPGGETYDEGSDSCIPCGFGKYRMFKKDPLCLSCPNGWTTMTNRATSIEDCVDTSVDPNSGPSCTDGYFYRDGLCRPCPIGYYKLGNNTRSCTECPFGFTTRRSGAWDESQCITMSSQCERQFDLVIAVDLSRSLYFDASHYVHLHLKPWLKCLIRRLDIHPYRVRVSIVKYAHGAATLVDLDNGYNAERICGLIDKGLRPSVNFNVNTATALHKVYDILRLQGRPGVQKHVLLIMDDPSDDQMAAEQVSKYLKDKQVHITVIGTDLYEISSLASSKYSVFPILDYGHLPRDYRVVRTVCRPRK